MLANNLINPIIQSRANTSVEWLGTDTIHNYEEVSFKSPNLYSRYDIEYKFNSHGFRCDTFDMPSDLPVVFLGCSVTEGIGVRQNEIWAYKLLEKIRQKTNKNIPYWNLALGGSGIDTQARNLYFLSNILNKKIKFVFSLLPPIARREYKVENNLYKNWVPMHTGPSTPLSTHVNNLFADSNFSTHQTERSLMTIDSICRQNDTKMYCISWDKLDNIKPLFESFPLINFLPITGLMNKFDTARDGIHPGPLYHKTLAEVYWNHVEKYFIDKPNI